MTKLEFSLLCNASLLYKLKLSFSLAITDFTMYLGSVSEMNCTHVQERITINSMENYFALYFLLHK